MRLLFAAIALLCGCRLGETPATRAGPPPTSAIAPPAPRIERTSTAAAVAPPKLFTRYFRVSAFNALAESISVEQVFTNQFPVTIAWDYSAADLASIDGFRLWVGVGPDEPILYLTLGKQLSIRWPQPTFQPTRIVLSWSAPAARISATAALGIPFQFLTNVSGTNITFPPSAGAQFYTADVPLQIEAR